MGNNGFYKKEITMKKLSLLLIAVAITTLNLDARKKRGTTVDSGAEIANALGKAGAALAGSLAKTATNVGVTIGSSALKDAVSNNDKIDSAVQDHINTVVDNTATHITSTANLAIDQGVEMAGHGLDHASGMISDEELAARAAESAAVLVEHAGAAAGNMVGDVGNIGGSIAQHYINKAGNTADPKKVAAAEEALEKAQEDLASAKKLGYNVELAETQVKEAEEALEKAKTPNAYLQQLAVAGGEAVNSIGSTFGDLGNVALTAVSNEESERKLGEADDAWEADTAAGLQEFKDEVASLQKAVEAGEDKSEEITELQAAIAEFRDGTPEDEDSGLDEEEEADKITEVNELLVTLGQLEVDILKRADEESEERLGALEEAMGDMLEAANLENEQVQADEDEGDTE
jgi:hypothetical protein